MCVCTSTCGEVRVIEGERGKEEGREGGKNVNDCVFY